MEVDYSEKCFAENLIKRSWSHVRKLSYKRRGKEAARHLQRLILQILSRLQFSPPSTESRKEELHRRNYTPQLSTLEPESVSRLGESRAVLFNTGKNYYCHYQQQAQFSSQKGVPVGKEHGNQTCIVHANVPAKEAGDFPSPLLSCNGACFPREPSTQLLCNPDSKLSLTWPLEPVWHGL